MVTYYLNSLHWVLQVVIGKKYWNLVTFDYPRNSCTIKFSLKKFSYFFCQTNHISDILMSGNPGMPRIPKRSFPTPSSFCSVVYEVFYRTYLMFPCLFALHSVPCCDPWSPDALRAFHGGLSTALSVCLPYLISVLGLCVCAMVITCWRMWMCVFSVVEDRRSFRLHWECHLLSENLKQQHSLLSFSK